MLLQRKPRQVIGFVVLELTRQSAVASQQEGSPEALLDQQQISPVVFCGVLLYAPKVLQQPMVAQ